MKWSQEKLDGLLDSMSEWPDQLMRRGDFADLLGCCMDATPTRARAEAALNVRLSQLEETVKRITRLESRIDSVACLLKVLSDDVARLRREAGAD